jgi:serine/threonine-protein kinase
VVDSPLQTPDGRALAQQRLAQLCAVMFWAFSALQLFALAIYIMPAMRPERAGLINAVGCAGIAVLGVLWLVSRRARPLPATALLAIDAASISVIGVALGTNVLLAADRPGNVYSAFIWLTMAVFVRVLLVPSSVRRTAVMSALAVAPGMAASQLIEMDGIPRAASMAGGVSFGAMIVVVAAVGARIIGGLRREARAARRLGQYTLGDKLGEGGMGSVYRASHVLLRRPAAIKLLRAEHQAAIRRFEREVQLTAELSHPNTVEIYDYGRSPGGQFYYVMEHLDGIDLDRLVADFGPMEPARAVHVLDQVCGALGEAHDRGLIHRDVKPGNIMLCQRGGVPDVAKVLDFGLVKDTAIDETSTDVITGTPAFLAPEAIDNPSAVGPATDIYALGAVAHYLVTGALLFDARTAIEMCFHHVTTAPQAAGIAPDFDALILDCLAKDPAARPPTAAALRRRLVELECAGRWTAERASRWWRINEPEQKTSPPPEGLAAMIGVDLDRHRRG